MLLTMFKNPHHIVDTDVLVLAVVLVCTLKDETEVWISFGTGNAFHFLAAHEISWVWVLRKFRQIRMFYGQLYLSADHS